MRAVPLASLTFTFTLSGLLFVVGCGDAESQSAASVATATNTVCPIMGHGVTDDGGRVTFEGEVVGFCCPGCIDKWNALSDPQKAEKLATGTAGNEHDHEHHEDQNPEDEAQQPEASSVSVPASSKSFTS